MKFSIKDFLSKCECDLVTLTEEFLNGKLHFLCSVIFGVLCLKNTVDREKQHKYSFCRKINNFLRNQEVLCRNVYFSSEEFTFVNRTAV